MSSGIFAPLPYKQHFTTTPTSNKPTLVDPPTGGSTQIGSSRVVGQIDTANSPCDDIPIKTNRNVIYTLLVIFTIIDIKIKRILKQEDDILYN
jgi:hypothetical protein